MDLQEFVKQRDWQEQFSTAIGEIIAENPHYIYRPTVGNCEYDRGPNKGCTGCILGRGFQRCGVGREHLSPDAIQELVNAHGGDNDCSINHVLTSVGVDTEDIPNWWREAQESQDDGAVWDEIHVPEKYMVTKVIDDADSLVTSVSRLADARAVEAINERRDDWNGVK